MPMNAILVSKGDDPEHEAYSGFQVDRLDLAEFLQLRKVERVFVTGLATEYCVRQTALDACAAGFTVYLGGGRGAGHLPGGCGAGAGRAWRRAGVIRIRRSSWRIRASARPPPTTSTATRYTTTTDGRAPPAPSERNLMNRTSRSAGPSARTWRC